MKRSLFGVLAVSVALVLAGCESREGAQGGGKGHVQANRFAVVVLIPGTQGRTCDVVAADNLAFRGDNFEWRVYSFCPGAASQHFTLQFDNGSPAQPNTEHFDVTIDSNPPGYGKLSMTVDKNPSGGRSCNGSGLCYKYSFYLAGVRLLDPDFEVDP